MNKILLIAAALSTNLIPLSAQPTIATQPVDQVADNGGMATFGVEVSGDESCSYQWLLNGGGFGISTIAGIATNGFSGDGTAATGAKLNRPMGVAFDGVGNLFIGDGSNNRVRKLDTNGIITTIAGTGTNGFSGDGGPAVNAKMTSIYAIIADPQGNLFIADAANARVRKIDTNGIITTVAGNGINGYSGDGSPATQAQISLPEGLALDAAGNLYLSSNQRIRKVATNGIITTIVGNGTNGYAGDGGAATSAEINNPYGVAVDAAGNLFIADRLNYRIREVGTNGIITTMAGNGTNIYTGNGGQATNTGIGAPYDLKMDDTGNLFFSSSDNCIHRIGPDGIITTMAGNGTNSFGGDGGAPTKASFNLPRGLAIDGLDNLFVADSMNNRIRKIVTSTVFPTLALSPISVRDAGGYSVIVSNSTGSVTSMIATLTVPVPPLIRTQPQNLFSTNGFPASLGVTTYGSGPLYFQWQLNDTNLTDGEHLSGTTSPNLSFAVGSAEDTGHYRVVVSNAWGSVTSSAALLTVGFPPMFVIPPVSLTVLPGSTAMFHTTASGTGPITYRWLYNGQALATNLIYTIVGNGTQNYSGDGMAAISTAIGQPCGLTFDAQGNLFITDSWNQRIRKRDTSGIITTVAGNGTGSYYGDGGQATNAGLNFPAGVAFDSSGNLYIADQKNNRIRRVDAAGIITTVAGNGQTSFQGDGGLAINASLSNPSRVAVDSADNLYIADSSHNRVRKVDANGIITTIVGTGQTVFSGNGGPATNAAIAYPIGMTFDAASNLFIALFNNSRIVKVDANGILTTVAGSGMFGGGGDGGAATNANFEGPQEVVLDPAGNMYISDYQNYRIRKVNPVGIITTVAGQYGGYGGDGNPAPSASFNLPVGLCLDSSGNLLVSDYGNNRVREIFYAGQPQLVISNVNYMNIGNYSVIISSPWLSITSSVVTLKTMNTILSSAALDVSGNMTLNFASLANITTVISAATNLAAPIIWQPIFTNVSTAPGTNWSFMDTNTAILPNRFYRFSTH